MLKEPPKEGLGKPRSSACANASLQGEITRLRQMSVEERILAALGMKSRFTWLQPVDVTRQGHEST